MLRLWDKAGEVIMHLAARSAPKFDGAPIKLYKNNVDNKGASYGCHENYLMARQTPFANIVRIAHAVFCDATNIYGSWTDGERARRWG